MRKQMKKAGAWIVAGAMLLTGCGKSEEGQGEATPTEPAGVTEGAQQEGTGPTKVPGINMPTPDNQDAEPENGGDDIISDEERAKTEVVFDTATEQLMYQGIYYEIVSENEVWVADYFDLEMTELTIPDSISYENRDYAVVKIAEDVFASYYGLEKAVLGANIREIADTAFLNCTDLKEVTLPEALTKIGAEAFSYCEQLEQLTIPDGVTTIGAEAFACCYMLSDIRLPETLEAIGENAFFDCYALERIQLPASLTTLPNGLFTNCIALQEVVLPEGLLVIAGEVFWSCESLSELVLPESLTYIGDMAFYSSGLERVVFPDKAVTIGDSIFDFCGALSELLVSQEQESYYQAIAEEYNVEVTVKE